MSRKKKKKKGPAAPPSPAAPKSVGTSLKTLLSEVRLEPPAEPPPKAGPRKTKRAEPAPEKARPDRPPADAAPPSEHLRGDDRRAYYQAMAGVRAFRRPDAPEPKTRVSKAPPEPSADQEARARLGALVAGGVRFELAHDGDRVLGRRAGLPLRVADDLSQKGVVPEATLDLHGERALEAERRLVKWIREQHRRGARRVCVVHGKGLHSAAGLGVLRDHVVHALTEGGAAPVVQAFASAHRQHGGTGALIVALV